MRTSEIYTPADPAAVSRFIAANPFAQVVSWAGEEVQATPLPLLAEADETGAPIALIGHFAKANPHVELLKRSTRAVCIFQGLHGYISPSWMRDRTQAPTWNFEAVHCVVDIELASHEGQTIQAIEDLVEHLEAERRQRWRSPEMGERHAILLRGVIGFRARVLETRVKFKMGQNERDDVYADIVTGLLDSGGAPLAHEMEALNGRCPHLVAPGAR
jgi:predicted FMN-binding regulatory protein PaiB